MERIRGGLDDFPARHRDGFSDLTSETARTAQGGGPGEDRPIEQPDVRDLLDHLRPRGIDVPMLRVGAATDGGYVIPDDLVGIVGVVSLGIGDEVSFDRALAERGLPVIQVDHSVDGPPEPHELYDFRRMRWARASDEGALSLVDIVAGLDARTGAAAGADLVLKFDVEGAEWDILDTLDRDLLRRFRIITCELHGLTRIAAPRAAPAHGGRPRRPHPRPHRRALPPQQHSPPRLGQGHPGAVRRRSHVPAQRPGRLHRRPRPHPDRPRRPERPPAPPDVVAPFG